MFTVFVKGGPFIRKKNSGKIVFGEGAAKISEMKTKKFSLQLFLLLNFFQKVLKGYPI